MISFLVLVVLPVLLGLLIWAWLLLHMGSARWRPAQPLAQSPRPALKPPPVVTVLEGVVIPRRKEIEP